MNPFALLPLRFWLYLGLFTALMLGAWRVHHVIDAQGYNRAKAEYTALALKAEGAAHEREQQLRDNVTKAENEFKTRETILAVAADTARTDSERMRGDLTSLRKRLPGLAEAAVRRYADTASAILDECQRSYQTMAATADRLDNDNQALRAAWPN